MAKETVRCPKDPENRYYVEACRDVFRKGDIRQWCKSCELFTKTEDGEKHAA